VLLCVFCAGCAHDESKNKDDNPLLRVQSDAVEVTEGVTKTVIDVSEEGISSLHDAGMKTGVTPAVRGVSQAIVETSEQIGQEQRGTVMGQEVILFPPETENEGKILRIEF
jgi:hypothetical protein